MAPVSRISNGNRLLEAMSPSDFALLRPHLAPISLPLRMSLEKPNKPIDSVYFLRSGIASVVAEQTSQMRIEIGIIGREGISGTAVLLGNDRSPHSTYIQVAGEGQKIPAVDLRRAMGKSRSLHALLLKFVQAFTVQTAHTAIGNARATIPERLARWLLMAHDRTSGNELVLTHEFLSLMIGVRRSGVTEALNYFQKRKFIKTSRSRILMTNRSGIEKVAGSFYGVPEKEYRRLMR